MPFVGKESHLCFVSFHQLKTNSIVVLLYVMIVFGAATADEEISGVVLNEAATRVLVHQYKSTNYWALKGFVLLSLGQHWHPVGGEIVLDALNSQDNRLRAFGIEALRRTKRDVLVSVITRKLVEELLYKQVKSKNEYYKYQVNAVLRSIVPRDILRTPAKWSTWWSKNRQKFAPDEWPHPPEKRGAKRTSAQPFIERVFDLHKAGLDIVICIDSTGSMTTTINLARDTLDEIVLLLNSIAPKLRVGLVHYRDFGDMSNGARMLVPLTKYTSEVRDALSSLVAGGGGDLPERVEKGLEIALKPAMRWKRETNKIILIVGDAPPHDDAMDKAISLAKNAFEKPFGKTKPTYTGSASHKAVRPFIVSAIALNHYAKPFFKKITDAGRGICGSLILNNPNTDSEAPADVLMRHILTMSFGARWIKQVESFLFTYRVYRKYGFIRG